MLRHVDRMRYLDQSTNTQGALRYARTTMFTPQNGDRRDAPNSIVIITDGVPQIPQDLNEARRLAVQEAELARQQGINVFAIGVGPQITQVRQSCSWRFLSPEQEFALYSGAVDLTRARIIICLKNIRFNFKATNLPNNAT